MRMMDKAKGAMRGRSDSVAKGVDAATEQLNKRTGGKYADTVTKGADRVKTKAREMDPDRRRGLGRLRGKR